MESWHRSKTNKLVAATLISLLTSCSNGGGKAHKVGFHSGYFKTATSSISINIQLDVEGGKAKTAVAKKDDTGSISKV